MECGIYLIIYEIYKIVTIIISIINKGAYSMTRICQITKKKPIVGNNVSHANNKTKRRFLPNLHNHRIFIDSENRWVSLRISNAGLRIINKIGIHAVLSNMKKIIKK